MKNNLLLIVISILTLNIQAQTKIVKAKAYLDVSQGTLIEPAILIIENGIITAINPKVQPNNAELIDLGTKTLLPGLMDVHVHLDMNFESGYQYKLVTENSSKATLRAVNNAEKTLMNGFTTIRNIGLTNPSPELIDVALAEASDSEWIKAPRIIPSGHMIGITGGHADPSMMGGFAENIMDLGWKYGIADGPEELLKAVRYQIKYGAKAIKIMATAGVMSLEASVGAQQMTNEEMKTVVDEAKRHDLTVSAHAHGTEGIIAAINAGVNSIEHGSLLSDEAIALMVEKNVFLVPTTGLLDNIERNYDNMDMRLVKKSKSILPQARKSVNKAIKAGVKIALGSDAPLIPHGENMLELFAMIERGMTPTDAIKAATINPAELLKLNDRGQLKTGFLADIIAVDENPLQNIKTLEKVTFVMKGGKTYKLED
tara:strand:- start:305 stop:1588 length:1284 start_codon:yes stop_codon:yes gene_type:complete